MKELPLLTVATLLATVSLAQWVGPSGGVLSTANGVSIEQNGTLTGGTGAASQALFETKLIGFPTTGPGSVPGGVVYPLSVSYTGNVGIGTNSPAANLDVKGSLRATNGTSNQVYLQTFTRGNLTLTTDGNLSDRGIFLKSPTHDIFTVTPTQLLFSNGANELMKVNSTGELAVHHLIINTENNALNRGLFIRDSTHDIFSVTPNRILYNNGDKELFMVDNQGYLSARKMFVTVTNPFPDYVFEKNYRLMSLTDLAAYVKTNKHLPNLPSAGDVNANNNQLEIGDMQTRLLEKIEELTLYVIQQQQQIEELQQLLETNE